MAVNPARRTLQSLARQVRTTCECSSRAFSPATSSSIRHFSSSRTYLEDTTPAATSTYSPLSTEPVEPTQSRWAVTPERMQAPYRVRIRDSSKPFKCNSDPARLDQFYKRFLGPGVENVLSEETKWLAVTHKSFEQGARGFNDRLAFFGRRILTMQTNLVLLNSSIATRTQRLTKLDGDREVFEHPALEGLENLTDVPINEILTKQRLATLAAQMDMPAIIRWLPRMPNKLEASGIDVVLASTVYAIIGAIALERGGSVAAQFARERVLKQLGIQ